MDWAIDLLRILDAQMPRPTFGGWFHWLWILLTIAAVIYFCICRRQDSHERVRLTVLWCSVGVVILEIYKMVNYTFGYGDGTITTDFQWYAFPFQFCSIPMYAGVLMGILKRGKIHDALAAFLSTYSVFAGTCVLVYPNDVFVGTIGINIQSMICHCSMIVLGAYLFASGYVKPEQRTILKALPVFAVAVGIASVLNEIAYFTGLLETETFNMFFISPHCEPSLPVYSLVQQVVPFPFCLIIYIAVFSLAAYLILLFAMVIGRISKKYRKS